MSHRPGWLGSLALLAVAVAVAACGGDDGIGSAPDASPPVDSPSVSCVSTAEPALVANSQFYPTGLTLDDDHVYLADFFTDLSVGGGNIYRASKAGGSFTSLYSVADVRGFRLEGLTHHGGALFWSEEYYANGKNLQRVRTMPATGGPATDVAIGELVHFVVDDGYLYLTRHAAFDLTVVERIPHGGVPEQLGTIMGQDTDLVADATHLYGITFGRGIWRMPKTGGDPTYIVPDDNAAGGWLLLDAERIYRLVSDSTGSLTSFSKLGGAGHSIDLPHELDHWGVGLVGEDDLLLRGTRSIIRLPKGGGDFAPVLCPAASFDLHYFAADATRVFFFAMNPKAPKPGVWAVDLP